MRRRLVVAASLCAGLMLAGCQTWQDRADSEALAECARIADAAKRKACQSDVMAAYAEAERKEKDRLVEAGKAADERELLQEVYGSPKDRS
ncbi:hypothetical protein [Hyphomonas sp.]|uniref:hypothetical protein n=1 Tax=Hyphomonas sp. TaxID=87 RepID=UPI00391CA615